MSDTESMIRLAIVAALGSYLYIKHSQRVRQGPPPEDPEKWTGLTIDVATLKPRVEELRRDYLREQLPAEDLCFQRALLDLARQVVLRMAFFSERGPGSHEHLRRH